MIFLWLTFGTAVVLLPAVAIVRSWTLGVPASAAVAVTTGAVGGSIATTTGTSPVAWCVFLVVVINVAAAAQVRALLREVARVRVVGLVRASVLVVLPLISLALFSPAPMGWDPRSIWWFHASWFLDGSETVLDGLTNPAMDWSHPTYPPGVPSLIATIWRVTGGENLALAQDATTVLTAITFGGLAIVLVEGKRSWMYFGAATAMTLSVSHLGWGALSAGYVDVLGAALVVTSLAAAVCVEEERSAVWMSAIALAAALSTKNEAAYFALSIVPIALWMTPHSRRRQSAAFAIAFVPFALWQLTIIRAGGPGDPAIDRGSVVKKLFQVETADRFRIAARQLIGEVGPTAGAACVAIGLLLLAWGPSEWRQLRVPLALTAACLLTAATTPLIYAFGEPEIYWWLGTSLGRVATTSQICGLAALVAMVPTIEQLIFGMRGVDAEATTTV